MRASSYPSTYMKRLRTKLVIGDNVATVRRIVPAANRKARPARVREVRTPLFLPDLLTQVSIGSRTVVLHARCPPAQLSTNSSR